MPKEHIKYKKESPYTRRRRFLKVVGFTTLAFAGLGGGIVAVDQLKRQAEEKNFYDTGLSLDPILLSPQEVAIVENEGWGDTYSLGNLPVTGSMPPEQERATIIQAEERFLEGVRNRMVASSYLPFKEASQDITINRIHQVTDFVPDGGIWLGYEIPDQNSYLADALFATGFYYTKENTWLAVINMIPPTLDPRAPYPDPKFTHFVNIALSYRHEMAHYYLAKNLIGFWRSQGTTKIKTLVDRIGSFSGHEYYAWADTARATLPLINNSPIFQNSVLGVFQWIAKKWEKHYQSGGRWHDASWKAIVDKWIVENKLGLPSSPLRRRALGYNSQTTRGQG